MPIVEVEFVGGGLGAGEPEMNRVEEVPVVVEKLVPILDVRFVVETGDTGDELAPGGVVGYTYGTGVYVG